MPTEPLTNKRRDEIREALSRYKEDGVSNAKIAAFIHEHRAALGGTISAETVDRFFDLEPRAITIGEKKVLLLERFLQMVAPPPDPQTITPINGLRAGLGAGVIPEGLLQAVARAGGSHGGGVRRDPSFEALCTQFQIDATTIDRIATEYRGVYEFYAHSEETPRYAVRGAMSLFRDSRNLPGHTKTMALRTLEIQRGQKLVDAQRRPLERWVGYFWESANTCVIVCARPSLLIPKFYVLQPQRHAPKTRLVTGTHGRMLKVGTTGGVFASRIVMVRNNDAYQNCDVVPLNSLPPYIREGLIGPEE